MTNDKAELLQAIIEHIEASELPQRKAAIGVQKATVGMRVAAYALCFCALLLGGLAVEMRVATSANHEKIANLDKRVTVVESFLKNVNFKGK